MDKIITEKITLWGVVQGVGFRPFVAKIADRLNLSGSVRNTGGLVEIFVMARKSEIDFFLQTILDEKPKPAEIVHIKREVLEDDTFVFGEEANAFGMNAAVAGAGFTILASSEGDEEAAMIPADLAVCDECLAEMRDLQNPRYNHPMISCMVCGPRYTITDIFPYDRENTSMDEFEMCKDCHREYTDVKDRRYHAQTISCHDCGPYLKCRVRASALNGETDINGDAGINGEADVWLDYSARTDGSDITMLATKLLKKGNVIAFKSMGGYNLIADPFNDEACEKLRTIKKREAKPFAVMFESVRQIREYCKVNEVEERLISSSARPIILLERLKGGSREIERSRFIGSFLPSMGAQYLILEKFGGPLVVTSANAASMPMVRDDELMMDMAEREELISAVIYNDRKIRIRMDDSVARVIDGQPQMIRRSKGYAPVPLYVDAVKRRVRNDADKPQIFAAGGQLKNSFAISKDEFVYVSQYFGDMDSEESQQIYAENVERMARMFRIHPTLAVCDMHPLYFSTSFCEKYAEKSGIEVMKVQHHHAHVASVMAENNLTAPVIGVSFDGTGYGTDGAIWGGEIMICDCGEFERKAHLKYIEMPGGDESMKDAAKAAVCYKYALEHGYREESPVHDENMQDEKSKMHDSEATKGGASDDCQEIAVCLDEIVAFSEKNGIILKSEGERKLIEAAVSNGINTIKSSSMGRLFDAVAALLGICSYNSYEGECAILLEDAAARAMRCNYAEAGAMTDSKSEADRLALEFHMQIRDIILESCRSIRHESGINDVVLTGGVFQNKILMESTLAVLRENLFNVYYNISVSPNDGGIALGQIFVAMNRIAEKQ